MVALSTGVRSPSMKPSANAVMRTIPRGWRRWSKSRIGGHSAYLMNSCAGIYIRSMRPHLRNFEYAAPMPRKFLCASCAALLPAPKAEMFHGNRRRLIDVVTRKERAHGNVTVVTVDGNLDPGPSMGSKRPISSIILRRTAMPAPRPRTCRASCIVVNILSPVRT